MNFKWDVVFSPAVTQINIDHLYFDLSPWPHCQDTGIIVNGKTQKEKEKKGTGKMNLSPTFSY